MTLSKATITRRALLRAARLFAASAALPGCPHKAADAQSAPSSYAGHSAAQPVVARSGMNRLSTYKVQLIPDEELERLHPQLVAIVDITLRDGTHVSRRVDAVRGTVANPMTRDEVIAKARDLMDGPLGPARSAQLVDAIFALDTFDSVRSLRPLLQHQ